jgi:hypothetical protein
MSFVTAAILFVALSAAQSGEQPMPDPVKQFIERMDNAPPEERVPNWETTKKLMARPAPAVGDSAPEFSLKTLDGKETYALSQFRGKQPVVLIFGSYT